MEQEFKNVEYVKMGENGKMNVCCLTLVNGFSAIGTYCIKRDENEEEAQQKSYEMAVKNLKYSNERRKQRENY